MQYLAETLDELADYADDTRFLRMALMVYKILSSIQKDTTQQSAYW